MSYTVVLLSKARRELFVAFEWYEEKQHGLGDRFAAAVMHKLSLIEQDPLRYPKRVKNYREAVVPVFPYLVVYRIHTRRKIVAVVSIFHSRRAPRRKLK